MAILEFIAENPRTLYGQIRYITAESKTTSTYGFGVNPNYAVEEMRFVKKIYHQEDRRQYKHFVISFDPVESSTLNDATIFQIGYEVGLYYANSYQILMAIHSNTQNLHIHYVVNSVNVYTGKKFVSSRMDLYLYKLYIDKILQKYNLQLRMYRPD